MRSILNVCNYEDLNMKLRKLSKLVIFIIVLFMVITSIYAIRSTIDEVHLNSSSIASMDDGWTLTLNGVVTGNVYLPDANIGRINESESVEIAHILTDYGFDNPCLSFLSEHSFADVYLNDEHIYSM